MIDELDIGVKLGELGVIWPVGEEFVVICVDSCYDATTGTERVGVFLSELVM